VDRNGDGGYGAYFDEQAAALNADYCHAHNSYCQFGDPSDSTMLVVLGIGLGVIAVATGGLGLVAEGEIAPIVLGATSVASGGGAAVLDTRSCLRGDYAACAGASLGWVSVLAGLPITIALAAGVSETSLLGSVVFGLLPAGAFNLSLASLTTDFALWLTNATVDTKSINALCTLK
jgi:hypothetical protein